ncbi:MAG: hypothetical protein Q4F57_00315 [Weeksellaceae bacterium]|nr:hypothetical protein [Weeksellaceae bacterium]
MLLYVSDHKRKLHIPQNAPLESSVWQAIELFDCLPESDGSYIGFIDLKYQVMRITKYNKYVWIIKVQQPQRHGSLQGYFTKYKCRRIISEIFGGVPMHRVEGLSFEADF